MRFHGKYDSKRPHASLSVGLNYYGILHGHWAVERGWQGRIEPHVFSFNIPRWLLAYLFRRQRRLRKKAMTELFFSTGKKA